MRFLTLSTTGIFNAIRPSLFPPMEGKETTTFLIALDYYVPDRCFLEDEQKDVETARERYDLERKRIRACVKVHCTAWGKHIEELQLEIIKCMSEKIRLGIYNVKPLKRELLEGY